MRIGSLFSGIGGLELGLEMCGMGPVIWQCDSDPYARAVLEQHWPGVRRYNDVREIDERAERPDIICGGFPCQPVSVAGKRKAQKDTRWLWPFFASVVAVLRPRLVFIENVPGLRTAGLRDVLADLAALGFDAEWGDFAAEDVGAPHRRRRLFVVAYSDGLGQQTRRPQRNGDVPAMGCRGEGAGHVQAAEGTGSGTGTLADTNSVARNERGPNHPAQGPGGWDADRSGLGSDVANADREGQLQPSRALGEFGGWTGDGGWTWPPEPDVGRVAHGVPARVDRLRLLGNACVPAQAALAFRTLAARATHPR